VIALVQFQKRWADSASAPLLFLGGGRAEVPARDYDRDLLSAIVPANGVDAAARLGAYRQQYWFRLITLMQKDFPLAGHLLGWEEFNPLAARYLVEHPPTGDLDELGEAFPSWLGKSGGPPLVVESARVDLAWSRAFGAEDLTLPAPEDLARLTEGAFEIVLQPCVQILSTSRNWFPLRISLAEGADVPAGAPKADRQAFAVSRTGSVLRAEPLEPVLAKILRGMRRRSWIESLERVVAAHPEAEERIPEWFSKGISLGWWAVVEAPDRKR
jgi:hypothetical protein